MTPQSMMLQKLPRGKMKIVTALGTARLLRNVKYVTFSINEMGAETKRSAHLYTRLCLSAKMVQTARTENVDLTIMTKQNHQMKCHTTERLVKKPMVVLDCVGSTTLKKVVEMVICVSLSTQMGLF
jgi:hypothetical protein